MFAYLNILYLQENEQEAQQHETQESAETSSQCERVNVRDGENDDGQEAQHRETQESAETSSPNQMEPPVKRSRKSYSFIDKAKILQRYFEFLEDYGEASYKDMEQELGVPKPVLHRWVQNKKHIFAKATDDTLKHLQKGRKSNKHTATFPYLYQKFRNARKFGKKVNFAWLFVKGKKIAHEKGHPLFTRYSTEVFIRKYGIKIRRVQRRKQLDKEAYEPKLREWHCKYREGVIKSGNKKTHYDEKWGRFKPSRRFNVDQTPLPFVVNAKTTYESKEVGHQDKVWVRQPGSGLEKRQCTLQLCFSPEDNHVRVEIIFRGTGIYYIN